jgi:hypothetical protein
MFAFSAGGFRMRMLIQTVTVLAIIIALSSSLSAQWPKHPTKGVPRAADGAVNLSAPAPRTADGKPDLSGNWVRFPNPGGRGAPPPPPPPGTPPVATFGDVGAGFPDGLPFTPWAGELKKKRMAVQQKDNPDALCLPMGFMQFHTHGQPRKVIQTPEMIVIIYEANYGLRYIFTDGRALPPQGEPQPWWYGYSVGRWDGDTLVVETNNLRGDGWLDVRGSPYTEQATITERFRRPSFGKLEIDITVEDPMAYTKPFTVRVNQQISVDEELIEFICNENQQFRKLIKID